MKRIFLSLGSNRGEREILIEESVRIISERIGTVVRRSSLYETESWGFVDQIPFLNQVVEVATMMLPHDILREIERIELLMGRERLVEQGYQPRTLDVDILFYDSEVIHTDLLQIPHRHLHNRKFVLLPMQEIAPQFMHPVFGKTVTELLSSCDDSTKVVKV
jgi:2-amino-4-hydroxy-6-hydroxymethyldihydropteridine diphosphokinase